MSSIKCCLALIKKEMILFFKEFKSRFIDIAIILVTNVVVFSYFITKSGINNSFGSSIFVGAIASFGLFESIWRATLLAQDAMDRKMTNFFVLPIPVSYVFISIAVSWAICSGILVICLVPLGKVLLWSRIDFSHASIWRFIVIFITGNIFYGFFSLWIASLVTNLRNTSWIWARLINPLFMFCGYYYSWRSVNDFSPLAGYVHFLNPLLYVLEGTKAAVLGQGQFLPFRSCFFVLCIFILICAYDGIKRFKKRLDCV
jgi:ABC-2 type transport system permease protein